MSLLHFRIDFSSSLTLDQVMTTPKLQDTYGAVVSPDGSLSSQSWGDKITGEKKGSNRLDDFFETGTTYINSLSLSGGTKNAQTFASYANTTSSGVMPDNEFSRHNMTLKETMLALDGKLHVDVSLNYIVQKVQNRPSSGTYYNPLAGLYRFPANGDFNSPSGTGYSNYYFNAGDIQNMGIESSIDYSMMLGNDITWKSGFNISWNQNEIKSLDDRSGIADEDRLAYAEIGSSNGMSMRLVEGGSYGDVYSKVLVRDTDGVLVLDTDGAPTVSSTYEKVGNVNPKWNLGWSNRFDYKNFQLYFLFNGSIGGDYLDGTQMQLDSWGVTQASADARDNGGVDAGDGTMVDAQTYYSKTSSVASEYLNSATNFRMRELSLGYTFRNLFFLYKDGDSDPEQITGTGNASAGYNNMSVPSTRSFGVNFKATF